jgi:GNAT superfamily N-acetyltransferase
MGVTPPAAVPGRPWPRLAPHPGTGWRQPADRVTDPGGRVVSISSWGDAVPGGYNGGFLARDAGSGEALGKIEYQSGAGVMLIAWIEVAPAHRRQGIGRLLLARLAAEADGLVLDPGMQTPDGAAFWAAAKADVPKRLRRG